MNIETKRTIELIMFDIKQLHTKLVDIYITEELDDLEKDRIFQAELDLESANAYLYGLLKEH